MSTFNGTEGSPISINDAADLTKEFRTHFPNQPLAQFIGKDWILQLLSQEGAMGLRIYSGLDKEGNFKPVVVAASANENDMLELIIDNSRPSPPFSSTANPLNS